MILRVDTGSPRNTMLFGVVYLVPLARERELFRLVGPCFVSPLTKNLYHSLTQACRTDRDVDLDINTKDWLLVIPLKQRNQVNIQSLSYEHDVRNVDRTFASMEAVVHLGPNPEDVQPLCSYCPNMLERLQYRCAPGARWCSQHVTLRLNRRIER